VLGDKGYNSEAVRRDIEQRGGEVAISSTGTRKIPCAIDKALYAPRNRIARFFNRAKNSRRAALADRRAKSRNSRASRKSTEFELLQSYQKVNARAKTASAPSRAKANALSPTIHNPTTRELLGGGSSRLREHASI